MLGSKQWRAASLLVVGSMLLAACGQAATPQVIKETVVVNQTSVVQTTVEVTKEVQVAVTATAEPTAAPTAAPEAKPADTVVVALQQEPDTLHPDIGSMMARTIVLAPVFVGCLIQDDTTKWLPGGCESVPTVDNGGAKMVGDGADKHLEITYKIRKDWRWTDGTPVTTKDVIYRWKLQMNPEFEIADRSVIEKIYSITATDDQTYVVSVMSEKQAKAAAAGTLKGDVDFAALKADYGPDGANFAAQVGPVVDPVYWANFSMGWLPEHILKDIAPKDQAASDFAKAPVGDGPFAVKEWKQGQDVTLAKSDKPFPLGDPKVNTIIYRFFGDSAGVKAALQNGEVDVAVGNTSGLSPADSPDLDKLEAAGAYKIKWQAGFAWEHIDLNTTKFPLDDVKVRQALAFATDKKGIADKLYFGKIKTVDLPGPCTAENCWAYSDNYSKYEFNTDKAKQLLAEAGWDCKALPCTKKVTEGGKEVTKKLEFTLMTTDRGDRQSLAQVIQKQWKAVNVGVNLQFLYGRGLFAAASAGGPLYSRTFDAAIYTWIGGDDPQYKNLYGCGSVPTKENGFVGQNNPGFCIKEADDALTQSETNADVALSRDKRKPFIETFFKLWSENVPVLPLFAATEPYVYRAGFENFKVGPTQYSTVGWNSWEWALSK
jgi:peptide/nickel transport system substrate-binding protein